MSTTSIIHGVLILLSIILHYTKHYLNNKCPKQNPLIPKALDLIGKIIHILGLLLFLTAIL